MTALEKTATGLPRLPSDALEISLDSFATHSCVKLAMAAALLDRPSPVQVRSSSVLPCLCSKTKLLNLCWNTSHPPSSRGLDILVVYISSSERILRSVSLR